MATTVPYNPVPSISPTEKAAPHISVSAPAAAFGVDVAEAFANVGKNVSHVGDEIFQRGLALQKLENQAAAKEAEADFTIELGKIHAQYNTLQGKAAADAYPKYAEEVQNLRVQIGSRLGNDTSRKLYDDMSRGIASRTIFNGAGYAATQNKAYLFGASEARVRAEADSFYQLPNDETAIRRFESKAKAEAIEQGHIKGWSPEQTENASKEYISKAWLNRITGLANTQPFKAKELLDANRGKLFGDDIRKAETVVDNRGHSAGSRVISEQVLRPIYSAPEGAKERSLDELVKAGEAIAEKQFPNDPIMKGYVRDRITIDYNRFKAVRKQTIDNATISVEEAVSGATTGKKLFTEQEIRDSSPKVAAAWDALPEPKKRAIRRQLVSNSRGDYLETPENKQQFTILQAKAAVAPDEFLKDTESGLPPMPEKWSDQLRKERLRLLKRGEQDPRVGAAMGVMTREFGAAVPKKADDPDRYYLFVGSVQNMMAEYEAEHKKPMPFEEKRKMGAFLLQKQTDQWFFERQKYEFDKISGAIDLLKKDKRWEGKVPSDEELRQYIVRDLYNRSYQKMKAKTKDQGAAPKGSPIGGTKEDVSD